MEAVHSLYQIVYSSTSRHPLVDDGLERIRDKIDVEVGEFFLLGNDSENIAGTVFLISFFIGNVIVEILLQIEMSNVNYKRFVLCGGQ
jgi:hypothetical protein